MNYIYTAGVTLLALLLHAVSRASPGDPHAQGASDHRQQHFEHAYRVHMNTIEQIVFFLPALWLCAVLLSDIAAAVGGLIWVAGRAIYAVSYVKDPAKRGPGPGFAALAQNGLWLGAAIGLVVRAAMGLA
jgi:glutathione S-transferase